MGPEGAPQRLPRAHDGSKMVLNVHFFLFCGPLGLQRIIGHEQLGSGEINWTMGDSDLMGPLKVPQKLKKWAQNGKN